MVLGVITRIFSSLGTSGVWISLVLSFSCFGKEEIEKVTISLSCKMREAPALFPKETFQAFVIQIYFKATSKQPETKILLPAWKRTNIIYQLAEGQQFLVDILLKAERLQEFSETFLGKTRNIPRKITHVFLQRIPNYVRRESHLWAITYDLYVLSSTFRYL